MIDYSGVKLGRHPAVYSLTHQKLGLAVMKLLPAPPPVVDNRMGITAWGMDGNDRYGDCVFAGLAHYQQVITADAGNVLSPSTEEVLAAYSYYAGFNPNYPSTDRGAEELDTLLRVTEAKDGIYGNRLLGFVSLDPKNIDHVKKAIAYFRAVYMGCEMPSNCNKQKVWQAVAGDGGTVGGHCMVAASYTPNLIPCITWGENQEIEWDWWLKYVDEAHVLVWETTLKLFPSATQQTILNLLKGLN
jgi:hypothetical protein